MRISKMRYPTLIVLTVGLMFIFVNLYDVSADIAQAPPSSINTIGSNTTYLQSVNVTLEVQSNLTYGHGIYIVRNPSNQTEHLQLYFYPGTSQLESKVYVNGIETSTTYDYLEPDIYHDRVILFNASVVASSSSTILIDWTFPSYRTHAGPSDQNSSVITTTAYYGVSYLIIGKAGWNHTIDNVIVTFILESEHFVNYTADPLPTSTQLNNNGTFLNYRLANFSMSEEQIYVNGETVYDFHEDQTSTTNQTAKGVFFSDYWWEIVVVAALVVVMVIIILLRRKPKFKEGQNPPLQG